VTSANGTMTCFRQLSEEHDLTPWFEDDELLAEVLDTVEGNTDPDDVPEAPEEPITKPGDLWILGNHRCYVATARTC
jgi:hypothetical protein